MGEWEEESKQVKASSGRGALAREIVLGLLPLVIAIATTIAVIAGLVEVISVALVNVGNGTLAQTKVVRLNSAQGFDQHLLNQLIAYNRLRKGVLLDRITFANVTGTTSMRSFTLFGNNVQHFYSLHQALDLCGRTEQNLVSVEVVSSNGSSYALKNRPLGSYSELTTIDWNEGVQWSRWAVLNY